MNKYEELLQIASDRGIKVHESVDLNGSNDTDQRIDGLYIDGNVALDSSIPTNKKRACVLSEELGHHEKTVGNIIDLNNLENAKQERKARMMAYDSMIGLDGLIRTYERHCSSRHESAEFLDVTEEFLEDCISAYSERYASGVKHGNYLIMFIPELAIMKLV